MKKRFLLFMFVFGLVISCAEEETQVYNSKDGSLVYYTDGTSGDFYVQDVTAPEFLIEVGVTTTSNVDRVFTVSIDPTSTATANQYTIDSSTLKIPANSNVGYIRIVGNYANSLTSGSKLILKLDSVSDAVVADFDNIYTLNIYQFCDFVLTDFLGAWDADEVGYQVYTSNFTQGSNTDLNEIIMSNIWDVNPSSQTKVFFNDSNPSNFKLDFPVYTDNFLYNNSTYGPAYIDRGEGNFSACAETVYMKFQVRVSAGFFAATEINFTKQ